MLRASCLVPRASLREARGTTKLLARRFTKRSFVRDPREFATQTMSCVARQANAIRFGSLALREFAAQTSTYGDAPLAKRGLPRSSLRESLLSKPCLAAQGKRTRFARGASLASRSEARAGLLSKPNLPLA